MTRSMLTVVCALALSSIARGQAVPAGDAAHGPPGACGPICMTPNPSERGFFLPQPWIGGNVFYEFNPSMTETERQQTLAAWARISAVANVRFIPRPFQQPNYLRVDFSVTPGVSFSSHIGMTGSQQFLRIWRGAPDRPEPSHFSHLPALIVHETLHALGLLHEHQRQDRDEFVQVDFAACDPIHLPAFAIINGVMDGPYDYASVMHYNQSGLSVNFNRTMRVVEPYRRRWQWWLGGLVNPDPELSIGDRWVLWRLYPGPIVPPPRQFKLLEPANGEIVGVDWTPAFSWQPAETATGYRLQVDETPTFASPVIDVETAEVSYTHGKPLPANRLYWWRVLASNDHGVTQAYPLESHTLYVGSFPGALYVDDSAPPGGDGSSWASAMNDLGVATETAYVSAGAVTEIRVAQGVYTPAFGSADRTYSFWLANGCALLGGFAGYDAPDPDARDIEFYQTVLSGDLNADDLDGFVNIGDNSYNVVFSMDNDSTAVLEGFTIRGGRDETITEPGSGAGLLIDAGSPTIRRCTFTGSISDSAGGALACFYGADADVVQCTLMGNRVSEFGRRQYFSAGGGALYVNNSACRFESCTIRDNNARTGAGAFCIASSPSFVNCVFAGNDADGRSWTWTGGGGVMSALTSNTSIVNCTIADNTSVGAGGGVRKDFSSSTSIANSILWNNTPDQTAEGPEISYSCIQGGASGPGNISEAPIFMAGGYALAPWSPGIDAASNAPLPASVTTDHAGLARFADDPFTADSGLADAARPELAIADMGAFEFQGNSCAADWNNDGFLDSDDLFDFLVEFFNLDADVNRDGVVNSQDLFDFLQRFFAGCP